MVLRKILDQYVSPYQRWIKVIRLANNAVLKTLTKTLTFVDADANAHAHANTNADTEGSTIVLRERCSDQRKMAKKLLKKDKNFDKRSISELFTGDETWVYYFELQRRINYKQWL